MEPNGDKNINPKVAGGAVGTALATVSVFVALKCGLEMSAEESVSITGAMAVIFGSVIGWKIPSN